MFLTDVKSNFELMYYVSQAFPISNGGAAEIAEINKSIIQKINLSIPQFLNT